MTPGSRKWEGLSQVLISCSTWKSGSRTSPGQQSRADLLGGGGGGGRAGSGESTKLPSPPVAGGRTGIEVMKMEEVVLPLTSCSTRESDSCTSSGQHSRADLVEGGR